MTSYPLISVPTYLAIENVVLRSERRAAANFVFQSGKNVLPLSPVSLSLSLSFLALFPILFAAEEASVSAAISFFIGGLSGLETTCVQ